MRPYQFIITRTDPSAIRPTSDASYYTTHIPKISIFEYGHTCCSCIQPEEVEPTFFVLRSSLVVLPEVKHDYIPPDCPENWTHVFTKAGPFLKQLAKAWERTAQKVYMEMDQRKYNYEDLDLRAGNDIHDLLNLEIAFGGLYRKGDAYLSFMEKLLLQLSPTLTRTRTRR